jgi:hypothetical protein
VRREVGEERARQATRRGDHERAIGRSPPRRTVRGGLHEHPADVAARRSAQPVGTLFTDRIVQQIGLLDSLVPQYPATGALAVRNHEYPFQRTATDWRAPCDEDAFTAGEIKRIRNCAGTLIVGLRKIFDALELLFP